LGGWTPLHIIINNFNFYCLLYDDSTPPPSYFLTIPKMALRVHYVSLQTSHWFSLQTSLFELSIQNNILPAKFCCRKPKRRFPKLLQFSFPKAEQTLKLNRSFKAHLRSWQCSVKRSAHGKIISNVM